MKKILVGVVIAFCALVVPLAVRAQDDTTPPIVGSFSVEPDFVDAIQGERQITVTLHMTDDLSGVIFFQFVLQPEGKSGQYIWKRITLPAGATDLTQVIPITLPANATRGHWLLTMLEYNDAAGNVGLQRPQPVCGVWWGQCFDKAVVEEGFDNGYPPRVYIPLLTGEQE